MNLLTRMVRRWRLFAKNERGGPMIEFAITLPILLILFAGATEVGRLFYTYTTLAKATKVGARYLSTQVTNSCFQLNGSSCPAAGCAVCTNARNLVICGNAGGCGGTGQPAAIAKNLTAANIAITSPSASSGTVTVSITNYQYQALVFNLAGLAGSQATWANLTLNPSSQMPYMR